MALNKALLKNQNTWEYELRNGCVLNITEIIPRISLEIHYTKAYCADLSVVYVMSDTEQNTWANAKRTLFSHMILQKKSGKAF